MHPEIQLLGLLVRAVRMDDFRMEETPFPSS